MLIVQEDTQMPAGAIRGQPIYFNPPKHQFIFYDGVRWVITATGYFGVVLNGATGGFHGSRNSFCDPNDASWHPR